MAVFDTYTQLRQAEDVQDTIYNISPIDAPVAAMSQTMRATGRIHEWTQDVLPTAGSNKRVEGAPAGAADHDPVTELFNWCQIMDAVASISGTLETVDKYGRDSEMAYQLELKYGYLANCEELAIVGAPGGTRQAGNAGNGSTAREMKSLHTQLDGDVIEDASAITTIPELEAMLRAAHLATYMEGGNPRYLFTPPALSQHISSFAYAAGRTRDFGGNTVLVDVIDLYVSNFGQLDVVLDRHMDDCFLLLDFDYLATPVLRPTSDWALGKAGDSDERQILRESTFAVLNTKAHAMVDEIPTELLLEAPVED